MMVKNKSSANYYWRAAAVISLLVISGLAIYLLNPSEPDNSQIAINQTKEVLSNKTEETVQPIEPEQSTAPIIEQSEDQSITDPTSAIPDGESKPIQSELIEPGNKPEAVRAEPLSEQDNQPSEQLTISQTDQIALADAPELDVEPARSQASPSALDQSLNDEKVKAKQFETRAGRPQ